jgi:hypothetical protein
MKTNQIVNFKRFGRYAKSTFILSWKTSLMYWGTIATAVLVISLFSMASIHSSWNRQGWIPIFLIPFFIGGILYAGSAFPAFRRKERSIAALMLPVTAFERFVYELFSKVVLFFALYPVVFYLSSSFAVLVRNAVQPEILAVGKIDSFPFRLAPLQELFAKSPDGQAGIIISLAVLSFVLAFTGAVVFRKLPLVKTIVFVGAIMAIIAGYAYLLIEKLNIRNPWVEELGDHWSKTQALTFVNSVLGFISLVALAFAYFKLKEKEVS